MTDVPIDPTEGCDDCLTCDPTTPANELMANLAGDASITLPDIDLTKPEFQLPDNSTNPIFKDIVRLQNKDLTDGKINGDGTFDALMRGFKAHLQQEFEAGRITGSDYTKSYIALTEAAMAGSVQFLLGRDAAYWSAVQAQTAASIAQVQLVATRVELETTKLKYAMAKYEALTVKSNYALAKMRLALESVNYCTGLYNLNTMLPQQFDQLVEQTRMTKEQADGALYQNTQMLPQQRLLLIEQTRNTKEEADTASAQRLQLLPEQVKQVTAQYGLVTAQKNHQIAETTDLLPKQIRMVEAQAGAQEYTTTVMMPLQTVQLTEQTNMIKEQKEAQRAQTSNTRSDGSIVAGSIGKQKELHDQQITSYKRDAEVKAARPFIDAWIAMKTIDEGLLPPNGFANTSLDQVLTKLKQNNQLS